MGHNTYDSFDRHMHLYVKVGSQFSLALRLEMDETKFTEHADYITENKV